MAAISSGPQWINVYKVLDTDFPLSLTCLRTSTASVLRLQWSMDELKSQGGITVTS